MSLRQYRSKLTVPVSELDHAQGPADAPVTLVEYGDYECEYCGRAYPVVKQLQSEMGDKLRFVFRNFPLNTIHGHASAAAQAAEAAAAQGKFWQMHDILYEHQDTLGDHDLNEFALKIGLEIYKFQADISSERYAKHVDTDFRSGVRSGVNGTPTFFINETRYDGANTYEALLAALQTAAATVSP